MLAQALILSAAVFDSGSSQEVIWHWDKDTPSCSLIQRTDDEQTVRVSRVPGQDETVITVGVRSPDFWKGLYEGGSVALDSGVSFPATMQVYSGENKEYELRATVTDPAFFKALAGAYTVTLAHRAFGRFSATLQKLAPAVAALKTCEDSRLRDWGIDVDAYWALASRPRPKNELVDLFSSDNYPRAGLLDAMERNVIARLEIGTDGTILSCDAPGHFAYPQFVDSVCKVLKSGAHFTPAEDASGKAVVAPYVVLVSFRMGRI